MALDYNSFQAICRIVADPDPAKHVGNRRVIRFRVAFTGERRKDGDRWENKPVFMDCEAWQGDNGPKLVDVIEKYARKGAQVFIVGGLKMDTWEDKNGGGKRQAIRVNLKEFNLLDSKQENESRGGSRQSNNSGYSGDSGDQPDSGDSGGYGGGDPIPF